MEQLRNINVDDIKKKVGELEQSKAKRSEIDEVMKKILEATQLIQKTNKTVTDIDKNTQQSQR